MGFPLRAILGFKCLHASAPSCLVDELCQVADVEARQRLHSASSSSLIVSRTRLSIVRRRPSLSGCRRSCLEQFTSALHFSTFDVCLPVTSQHSSLHHFRSRLRSADNDDMIVPRTRTVRCGLLIWNMLPLHLKNSNVSREQFKSGLKTWLFVQAYS